MGKLTTTEIEKFLNLDTEIICSMEHRERIEAGNLMDWLLGTTVTSSMTTEPGR